jgi:predicted PurR-regulated permease PerM
MSQHSRDATDDGGAERVRIGSRSIVLAIVIVAVVLMARVVVHSSTRVIGWFLAAAVVAALVAPVIQRLDRSMPRAFAVLIVVVGLAAVFGSAIYIVFSDIQKEISRVQEAAPEVARDIEASPRFGKTARDLNLSEHVSSFVDQLPERVQGGDTAQVIRAAATRGVSFLVGLVLTLFMVSYGPRLLSAGLRQIDDEERRRMLEHALVRAYRRTWLALSGRLLRAMGVGLIAYGAARLGDLPGARVLALFCAAWSIIPSFGIIVGAIPIIVFAGGFRGTWSAVGMVVFFFGLQVLDAMLNRVITNPERLAIGPVVPLLAGMLGFETNGIGGALVAVAFALFGVALLEERSDHKRDANGLGQLVER